MQDLLGEPMLFRQIERIARSQLIDKLIVATSTDTSDDLLEKMCLEKGFGCFRGSLDDVLDRVYRAAERIVPLHVVCLTGDCPLTDPVVIDSVIEKHLLEGNDYTSNTNPPTFPDGLDAEAVTFTALKYTWANAVLPSEREHVTPFLYKNPKLFQLGNLQRTEGDLSHQRWTVDEPEDLIFVRKVYQLLYEANPSFTTEDVLDILSVNPEFCDINKGFERNEGYAKSLVIDKNFKNGS